MTDVENTLKTQMLIIFRNGMSQNRVSTGFLVDYIAKNAETTMKKIATFYAG